MDDQHLRGARAPGPDTRAGGSRTPPPAFDEPYWQERWRDGDPEGPGPMEALPPHPYLVREVGTLTPGTALDVGCGAGTEAIWLAGRGWEVVGTDVADGAVARAAARAAVSGVADRTRWVRADVTRWAPDEAFDLVTSHYTHAALPQLDLYERIAAWVAPGGTLLVVAHRHDDGHTHRPGPAAPPASATVTATSVAARLDPSAWDVVTAEESRRTVTGPGGHPVTLHDVVLRARRRP